MNGKERDEHEIHCPKCGADAEWSFLTSAKTDIEVMCPDCGRFTVGKEEFDSAIADRALISEDRE